jgi:signal transduction histidine kinase
MKHDFQRSASTVVGGNMHLPVLVPQISPRPAESRTFPDETKLSRQAKIRVEKWREGRECRERKDSLYQGSLAAAGQPGTAVENIPAGSSAQPSLNRILRLIGHAVQKGRAFLCGTQLPSITSSSLEQSLLSTIDKFSPKGVRVQVVVTGQAKELKPEIQEEVCLIAREALSNALRHSEASLIEVEIEYLRRSLRLIIRDDGRGIDCTAVKGNWRSHGGLQGMQERAQIAGGRLCIWSGRGAGTEVEVAIPLSFAASAVA